MRLEKTIPFTWKGWDDQDTLVNSYYDVEFVEDFGIIKKGDKFSCITVDYGSGVIEVWNDSGTEIIKKQNYKATPIN